MSDLNNVNSKIPQVVWMELHREAKAHNTTMSKVVREILTPIMLCGGCGLKRSQCAKWNSEVAGIACCPECTHQRIVLE